MGQADNLLDLFHMNGNRLTLAQLYDARYLIGTKYTNRIDDLRKRGYSICCTKNHLHPGENLYTLVEFRIQGGQKAFA